MDEEYILRENTPLPGGASRDHLLSSGGGFRRLTCLLIVSDNIRRVGVFILYHTFRFFKNMVWILIFVSAPIKFWWHYPTSDADQWRSSGRPQPKAKNAQTNNILQEDIARKWEISWSSINWMLICLNVLHFDGILPARCSLPWLI